MGESGADLSSSVIQAGAESNSGVRATIAERLHLGRRHKIEAPSPDAADNHETASADRDLISQESASLTPADQSLEDASQSHDEEESSGLQPDVAATVGESPEEEPREQPAPLDPAYEDDLALARIAKILLEPGVKDAVNQIHEKFDAEPGKPLIFGITESGLILAVREGSRDGDPFKAGYFRGWVLDATLPADQVQQEFERPADFSIVDVVRLRDGGTIIFPAPELEARFKKFADKTDYEIGIARDGGENFVSLVRFYEKTGGFIYPNMLRSKGQPSMIPTISNGSLAVYPLWGKL